VGADPEFQKPPKTTLKIFQNPFMNLNLISLFVSPIILQHFKRILSSVLLFVMACFFTFSAITFPDIQSDYTSVCSAGSQSTRFVAVQTKMILQCNEGDIKIKCNINGELCTMMQNSQPTLSNLKIVRTSFLEDYWVISADVDGREVSYLSAVEAAATRALRAIWVYVALVWVALFLNLYLFKRKLNATRETPPANDL
jgi:hypothetical protein